MPVWFDTFKEIRRRERSFSAKPQQQQQQSKRNIEKGRVSKAKKEEEGRIAPERAVIVQALVSVREEEETDKINDTK